MSVRSTSRVSRTLLVGCMLAGAYVGYSRLSSMWLTVERREMAVPGAATPINRAPEFHELAERWFPGDAWVASAGKRFRDGPRDSGRYLFMRTFELFNEDHSIQVRPIALLWEQGPGREPIRATAESAQLDRSAPFSAEDVEFGRITSGLLSGGVRISGPDGLRIEGTSFHVSEDSMRIWSNEPVRFWWQTHSAVAERGIDILLLSEKKSGSERGLLSVNDINQIRLNGRVTCHLNLLNREHPEQSTQLHIRAARGMEYFAPTHTATFSGFVDQPLRVDNQILVERPVPDEKPDQLFCSRLVLQFRPRLTTSTEDRGTFVASAGELTLQTIEAEGRRVVVQSPRQNLKAVMTNLRYTLDQRLIELWDHSTPTAETRPMIRLLQNGATVMTNHLLAFLDPQNNVSSVECRGPGSINNSDDSPAESVDVVWSRSLVFRRSGEQKLVIDGDVTIAQPARQFQLSGDRAEMQLEPVGDERSAETHAPVTVVTAAIPQTADVPVGHADTGADFSHLKPRRLTVRGHVRMQGEHVQGTAENELTAQFVEQPLSAGNAVFPTGFVVASPAGGTAEHPAHESGANDLGTDGFTHFSADTVETVIAMERQGKSSHSRMSNVWLKGHVNVEHTAIEPDQSFHAEGNMLFAEDGFSQGRRVSLFGDPAWVVSTSRRIEGQRIDFSELQREAVVEGSGRIRLVVDRDLEGQPLAAPSPLDIFWGDRMTFSGRIAGFHGNVRAVLVNEGTHEMEVLCSGMTIQFTGDVAVQQSTSSIAGDTGRLSLVSPGSQKSEIETIVCHNRVALRLDQMLGDILVATHHAEVNDLQINQLTGEFSATGPGWIESVQPDRGNRLKSAPVATARANTPGRTTETGYVYVRADFIGSMSGNFSDQVMRLEQHVKGVFGPVAQLTDSIRISDVSTADLPERTGVLRCGRLTIASVPGDVPDEPSFSLNADENARLESRQFSGDADRITYDHSKQQFILRAEDDHLASVLHRNGTSGDVRSFVGKRFEYYPPPRNQLIANQIIGVQAAE